MVLNRRQWHSLHRLRTTIEDNERIVCELVMKIISFYTIRIWPIVKKIDKKNEKMN